MSANVPPPLPPPPPHTYTHAQPASGPAASLSAQPLLLVPPPALAGLGAAEPPLSPFPTPPYDQPLTPLPPPSAPGPTPAPPPPQDLEQLRKASADELRQAVEREVAVAEERGRGAAQLAAQQDRSAQQEQLAHLRVQLQYLARVGTAAVPGTGGCWVWIQVHLMLPPLPNTVPPVGWLCLLLPPPPPTGWPYTYACCCPPSPSPSCV